MSSVNIKSWKFPAGELGVRILNPEDISIGDYVILETKFESSDCLVEMLLLADATRAVMKPEQKLNLVMKYFPYARQDRRSAVGESHSLKVVANLVNMAKFDKVIVWDPHSDVVEALVDNLKIVPQWGLAKDRIKSAQILIAPDAGAAKKIYKLATLKGSDVIVAGKQRDTESGNLKTSPLSNEDIEKLAKATGEIWMVDDICDGGGTFIGLLQMIQSQMKQKGLDMPSISLYTTHGIYSKGKACLYEAGFTKVECANDMRKEK